MPTGETYMKKLLAIFLLLSPLVAVFVPSPSAAYNAASASSYLTAKPQNAWTIMGLSAAGQNPASLDDLKTVTGNQAIAYEAPILALTAAGQNPKTFGNENIVDKLKSFYNQNQMGDPSSLNDDIFGLLALLSSGEAKNSPEISGMKAFVAEHQSENGGWGYAIGSASDTDTTAAAICALIAAGMDAQDAHIQTALSYIKSNQNPDGGFLSNTAFDSNSNTASTAWVIWALNSLNINPESLAKGNKNPVAYLTGNQNEQGWFADQSGGQENGFTPVTTAYAAIALSGKTLPIKILSAQPNQSVAFRIEGKNETICEGLIAATTALDVVKNAASQCGYSYNIQDTQYGPYLNQIGNDAGASLTGWQYAVNLESPSVGAADYLLKDSDQVLWYFGGWDDKLTRLSLDKTSLTSGQSANATLEFQKNSNWEPLSDTSLFVGSTTILTNTNGQATLSSSDGYYRIYAQKPGFVRSNSVLLKIGEPQKNGVGLSVNIPGVNGEETEPPIKPEIAFNISPGNLDFGDLSAGQKLEKTLFLNNTGSKNLTLQSVVEGDTVFKDNLKLQNSTWTKYQTQINTNGQTEVAAQLSIPATFSGHGKKQGQIIFWAKAQ